MAFEKAWSSFLDALVAAEAATRDVVSARVQGQALIHELADLVEDYPLVDVEVPPDMGSSQPEQILAGLLGLMLRGGAANLVADRRPSFAAGTPHPFGRSTPATVVNPVSGHLP